MRGEDFLGGLSPQVRAHYEIEYAEWQRGDDPTFAQPARPGRPGSPIPLALQTLLEDVKRMAAEHAAETDSE